MLLSRHSLGTSHLHVLESLLLKYHLHLSSLFYAQLENLQRIFNQAMFNNVVYICVSPETWHVVDFQHPWF